MGAGISVRILDQYGSGTRITCSARLAMRRREQ
jgi:hypothetical protein